MKRKGLLGVTLALLLAVSPLGALAANAVEDPGPIPVDGILESDVIKPSSNERLYDNANALTPLEKSNLNRILERVKNYYGVEVLVEYLNRYPSSDSRAWSAERSEFYDIASRSRPAIYMNIAVQDREYWFVPNESFEANVPESVQNEIMELYTTPNFKENRFLRGLGMTADAFGRSYNGFPLIDPSAPPAETPVAEPEDLGLEFPVTEEEEGEVTPPLTSTEEDRARAQEKLDAYLAEQEKEKNGSGGVEVDPAAATAVFLWILGAILVIGVVGGGAYIIVTTVKKAKFKKRQALELIEKKRIQRLVDQLTPRLRNSDDFKSASGMDERIGIADRASFAVFGLKEADKDTVLRLAVEQVKRELSGEVKPEEGLSSFELMNLSVKALAEKKAEEAGFGKKRK